MLGPIVAWQLFTTISHAGVHVAGMNPQLDQSRELAGKVFGNILTVFARVELVCMVLMAIAVTLQMLLYLHLWNMWVWLRALVLALLIILALHDIFFITPQVHLQHRLWVGDLSTQPAQAKIHQRRFAEFHAAAEHDGAIEAFFLLTLLLVSAWGINYPSRKALVREMAVSAGVLHHDKESRE